MSVEFAFDNMQVGNQGPEMDMSKASAPDMTPVATDASAPTAPAAPASDPLKDAAAQHLKAIQGAQTSLNRDKDENLDSADDMLSPAERVGKALQNYKSGPVTPQQPQQPVQPTQPQMNYPSPQVLANFQNFMSMFKAGKV